MTKPIQQKRKARKMVPVKTWAAINRATGAMMEQDDDREYLARVWSDRTEYRIARVKITEIAS